MQGPITRIACSDPRPALANEPAAFSDLICCVRSAVRRRLPAAETASRVAEYLGRRLPSPNVLTPAQRLGDPHRYEQHLLHAEPNGDFSIVGLVWRPGQATPVHDHVSWCVVAVLQGTEHETLYELRGKSDQRHLVSTGENRNTTGFVCAFAPPGDIHRVRNGGRETAISLHVYGADITKLGTSIRRRYDLAVRNDAGLECQPA